MAVEDAERRPSIPIQPPSHRGLVDHVRNHWAGYASTGTALTLAGLGLTYLTRTGEVSGPQTQTEPTGHTALAPKPPADAPVLVVTPREFPGFPAEVKPTFTPEPTATKPPEPTQTPEATPEPAPCTILPAEYCSEGERVLLRYNYLSPPLTRIFVRFNLPEGVPLFSPIDGLLDPVQESGNPFSGLRITVRQDGRYDGSVNPSFRGDIVVPNMLQRQVKQGDIIGYTGNSGVKNLGGQILFTVTAATPQGGINNEEAMQALLHSAFEKPIRQTFTQEAPGIPTVSTSYSRLSPKP